MFDREIVQSQGLPFTDWNPILQEVFTCDLKGANFYALLKISRLLVELKKRKLLENVVEIFSSDEKFHRHILQLYTLPCSVWIGSHNQEKQVEGGIVQASRTLPTINESIIKYLTETIQKLGKTAARTFESITILMLLGYDPSDPNAVQNSTRNMDSQLQAVTKTWLDFAKLVNATMESKSVVMRCTIMLLESTNSDALIPTAIKNIPSFYKDPAFPVWSAFFLHVLQSRIRPSFQQLLLLFDFQASYNPPLFPQQMEALFNNSVYFDDKILYVADSLVNKLLNNSKILEAVFCRPHVTGTLIEDDTNLHCLLSRAKLLEALCKAQPDANMAKRVGKLIEALGNYSRTQSMIAGRKHLVTECVSVLRILMQHFTGDEKVYLISQKTMIVKWLKSKKAVAEICMTL